jgi:4-azaleucine resistance transporter AzlC
MTMETTQDKTIASPERDDSWMAGALQASPVVLGYVPVGFAYGVLASKAGLSVLNAVLMSVLVYGGASQFIAVGLMAAGASALTIILTTFAVNLRHLIMASAMAPYLSGWRKLHLAAFSYELTDETFALHSVDFIKNPPQKRRVFALNSTCQLSWVAGSYLGAAAGNLIPDVKPYALDFALPALFVALVVFQAQSRLKAIVAVATGAVAVALYMAGMNQWYVILAAVIGATFGTVMEQWIKQPSS